MALLVSLKASGGQNQSDSLNIGADKTTIDVSNDYTYIVIANSANDNADTVIGSYGLPKLGQLWNWRKCTSLNATSSTPIVFGGRSTNLWEVVAHYEKIHAQDEDPTTWDPEISWSTETYEEVLKKDMKGKAVKTKCGEPILLTVNRVCPVATITKYQPESYQIPASSVGCVNSGAFMGWPAKSALLKSVGVTYEKINVKGEDRRFAKLTATVVFKNDGTSNPWKEKVLHQGRKCKNRTTGKIEVWQDKQGNTGLVNLDSSGYALDNNEDEQYLEFDVYDDVSFSSLGL